MWTIYKLDCNFFSLYRLCFSVKMLNNYFLCSGCQFYTFSTYKKISLCVLSCKLVMWLPAWVSLAQRQVSVLPLLSQDSPDDGLHSEEPRRDPGAAVPRRRPCAEKQRWLELLPHRLQGGRSSGRTAPACRRAGRLADGEQDMQDSAAHCG